MNKPKRRDLNQKTVRFEMRMTEDKQEEWRISAARARVTLAQWIRDCCNAAVAK